MLRRKATAVCLVLACLTAIPGCSLIANRLARASTAIQLTELCRTQVGRQQFEDAQKSCGAATRLAPQYAPAWYFDSFADGALGSTVAQLNDLGAAIADDPSFAKAFAERCMVRLRSPAYATVAQARDDCSRAAVLAPKDPFVLGARFAELIRLHAYRNAAGVAHTLEKLQPWNAMAFADEADAWVRLREFGRARSILRIAERRAETMPDFLIGLAVSEVDVRDWKAALADADEGVRLAPSNPEAYNNRCWIRVRMNYLAGAQRDCAVALALSGNDPHIRDTRADILYRRHDYQGVIADENAMIAKYPSSSYGYGNRCAAETALGKLDRAWQDCAHALSVDPELGLWYVNRGDVERARGELRKALADDELGYKLDPTAIEALRQAAIAELALGRFAAAVRDAREYTAANPYDPVGLDVLGQALAAVGEQAAAVRALSGAASAYRARGDYASIARVESRLALLGSPPELEKNPQATQ